MKVINVLLVVAVILLAAVASAPVCSAGGAGANWLVSVSNMTTSDVAVTLYYNDTTKGDLNKLVTIQAGKGYTFSLGEGCGTKLTGTVKDAASTKVTDRCIQSDCGKACRNTSWKVVNSSGAYTFEVF